MVNPYFKCKKMKHTYSITGMTCGSCEAKVKSELLSLENVTEAQISKDTNSAILTMNKHIALPVLQNVLSAKYQILEFDQPKEEEQIKSWIDTYKPILLIFIYLTGITLSIQIAKNQFDTMQWMSQFMAGFFITFSFFKMLNLSAFADSYAMYDVVAKQFKPWGFIYPFVELGLGVAFLIQFQPFATNLFTFIVMTISIIGVLQSVLNKKKIQCACLGAIFNLPMSTVTIIEDGIMIAMSGFMFIYLL